MTRALDQMSAMPDDCPQGTHSPNPLPEGIRVSDYHLIEDAVMETPRGRWFLREFAQRIRAVETAKLLDAISRLQDSVNGATRVEIVSTKMAVSEVSTPGVDLEQVMAVQEKLLDMVWYMRERGFDGRLCTALTGEAEKLFAAVQRAINAGSVADHHRVEAIATPPKDMDADEAVHRADAESVATTDVDQGAAQDQDMWKAVAPATAAPHFTPARPAAQENAVAAREAHEQAAPLPSKAAALAQKASVFSAIDALPVRQKLAFFS